MTNSATFCTKTRIILPYPTPLALPSAPQEASVSRGHGQERHTPFGPLAARPCFVNWVNKTRPCSEGTETPPHYLPQTQRRPNAVLSNPLQLGVDPRLGLDPRVNTKLKRIAEHTEALYLHRHPVTGLEPHRRITRKAHAWRGA